MIETALIGMLVLDLIAVLVAAVAAWKVGRRMQRLQQKTETVVGESHESVQALLTVAQRVERIAGALDALNTKQPRSLPK